MTLSREVQDFLPLGITALLLWGAYKVTTTEIPALENAITARLNATVPTANAPTVTASGGGLTSACSTSDGIYWTQLIDGNWYGRPYCAPGMTCSQAIQIRTMRPC